MPRTGTTRHRRVGHAVRRVPAPTATRRRPSSLDGLPRRCGSTPRPPPPPPRAGRSSAEGSGGPPTSRRPTRLPSGSSTAAPQVRHRPALAASRDRALAVVVDVVDRPRRLVVGGEVAAWVVRAPPEDVPGPPRATRHQVTVAVLGADDLERQLVRGRRPVLADERAVRVARAAHEGAELAALGRQDAPRRTADTGRRRPRASGVLVEQRAGSLCGRDRSSRRGTDRLRPRRITIGCPSEQTSSVASVVKLLRLSSLRFSSTRDASGPRTLAAAAPTRARPR